MTGGGVLGLTGHDCVDIEGELAPLEVLQKAVPAAEPIETGRTSLNGGAPAAEYMAKGIIVARALKIAF